KSELRPENFRALHQPLGLGTMRADPAMGMQSPFPHPAGASRMGSDVPEAAEKSRFIPPVSQSLPQSAHDMIGPQPPFSRQGYEALGKTPKGWKQILRLALVHALDLAFVCLCLSLGLILLSWVIDPQNVSLNPDTLKQASPLQFLQNLQI